MMNHKHLRLTALALCLILCLSLLSGVTAFADDGIWMEEPTGWINWGHVTYQTVTAGADTYLCNWGVRGELCRFRSACALDYYPDLYDGDGFDWCYDLIGVCPGGTGAEDATQSELYQKLHDFLASKQTHQTTFSEAGDLFQYTDCMANTPAYISSFYSGRKLNGAWDSGATWNPAYTWPQSKATGDQNNDILLLRPTSVQENSTRSGMAYGESEGYYNPNAETDGTFDLRGDCARICLYCCVRYPENAGNLWGQSGVMESLDVLLDWMEQDPVDTWEMGRNDAVESITGVRNCFVDYPELVWALFGREMPGDYPTPFKADHNNFVSVPACLMARSNNEAWGTVAVKGWAVDCTPAEGYYASGYDLWTVNGKESLPQNAWEALFRWENGQLLYFPRSEENFLVEIHFTPIGETDPCPTGHAYDYENPATLEPPTCTDYGVGLLTCSRCGRTAECGIPLLGHSWDEGVVTKPATIDEWGTRLYTCTRCGETMETEVQFEFDDVKDPSKVYYDSVYWALLSKPRITAGVDNTHFCPQRTCTRCEAVTFLWRAAGQPEPKTTKNPFADVKESAFYYKAVLWAVEQGITQGSSKTTFSPMRECTRGEIVTFLYRAFVP